MGLVQQSKGLDMSIRSAAAAGAAVLSSAILLCGCGYLETQPQRQPTPDTRIQLDWQERRSLHGREIRNYACGGRYRLHCERGGAVTYSCTCVLP